MIKTNIIKHKSWFMFLFLFFPNFIFAQNTETNQHNFTVFSASGGTRTSANYQQYDCFGEPVAGLRTSANFLEQDGFIYQTGKSDPCFQFDLDCDCDVDIVDIQTAAFSYGTSQGDPNYNLDLDFDNDGDIDIVDIQQIAYYYGWTSDKSYLASNSPVNLIEIPELNSQGIHALVEETTVEFDPENQTVEILEQFSTDIYISNVENMGGFSFELNFDASIINVTSNVVLGDFLSSSGRQVFPLENTFDNSTGTINYAVTTLGSSPPGPDGSDILVTVNWEAVSTGTSQLEFFEITVVQPNGTVIPIITNNGEVIVGTIVQYYDVTTSPIPLEGGTTTGDGAYEEDSEVTVTASENVGWEFVNWTENGIEVSDLAEYTFIITVDINLQANFTQIGVTTVEFDPESQTVEISEQFSTDIYISNVNNLGGFSFELNFDATIINVASNVVLGGFLGSTGRQVFPLENTFDNSTGTINYAITTLGSSPPGPNGSGILITVNWEAVSIGTSQLEFFEITVVQPNGTVIAASANSGEIIVEDESCNPWQITPTLSSHTIAIPLSVNPNINGDPLEVGDWIGAFYVDDNGEFACGGAVQWNGSTNVAVIAFGNDNTTPEKDGFGIGETIHWKIFDCSGMKEYQAYATYDPTYQNHDGVFAVYGLSSLLSLETVVCQTLLFNEGWNGVSLFINPNPPEVEFIFSPYPDFIFMQSLTSIYWPAIPVNTIVDWDISTGYAVKIANDHQIELCGSIPNERTISLSPGWHYLPVLSECAVSVAEIFDPVQDKIVFAKELIGTKVYWPSPGVYTLHELVPGGAYAIKLSQEATFTFPNCGKQTSGVIKSINYISSPWGNIELSPKTHAISIPKTISKDFGLDDHIGIFDEHGLCYGSIVLDKKSTSVLFSNADDKITSTKDGFTENEPLEFRLWKVESGEEFVLDVTFDPSMPNPDKVFANNGLSSIIDMKISSTGISQFDSNPVSIYPNPTLDKVNIQLSKACGATVSVFDMTGQQLLYDNFIGIKTEIDLSTFESGIYLIEVKGENILKIDRLIKK